MDNNMQFQAQYYPIPNQNQTQGFGNNNYALGQPVNTNMMPYQQNIQMAPMGNQMFNQQMPMQQQMPMTQMNMISNPEWMIGNAALVNSLAHVQQQAALYPILQQNMANPFVRSNPPLFENFIFLEKMKYNLVNEANIQEFSNLLQRKLVRTNGSPVYPNVCFSRGPMEIKCSKCGNEGPSDADKECGSGNLCCCLQGFLFPYPGLILSLVYNLCSNEYHDFKHKCTKCKHTELKFITEAKHACICYSRYTQGKDKPPLDIYQGKGIDAFIDCQQWPGRNIQQMQSRGRYGRRR